MSVNMGGTVGEIRGKELGRIRGIHRGKVRGWKVWKIWVKCIKGSKGKGTSSGKVGLECECRGVRSNKGNKEKIKISNNFITGGEVR